MRNIFGSLFGSSAESLPNLPELNTIQDCEKLLPLDLAIVFKHSTTCITSAMAHRQVIEFQAGQPEIPVYIVLVRRCRDVSRHLAEYFSLEHESPQVLVLAKGSLIASASHNEVTAEFLTQCVACRDVSPSAQSVTTESSTSL